MPAKGLFVRMLDEEAGIMSVTRRRFLLTTSAGLLSGVGLLSRLGFAATTSRQSDAPLRTVRRATTALGTHVSITAMHASPSVADRAIDAAFAELRTVQRTLSLYIHDSQIVRLNRDRVLDDPHPYTVAVLHEANSVAVRTGGAFDVTVQPLWRLYADAQREGTVPDVGAIDRAREAVDYRHVDVGTRRVRLTHEAAAITLNGIAQGFALDRVRATLRAHGVAHAIIDTGEVGSLGSDGEGGSWSVGIQHPRQEDAYIAMAKLDDRCLATSGDYATPFTQDRTAHHIFDPRTGRSPEALAGVCVVAPTGMMADALSTALLVMGPDDGTKLVSQTPGVDALFVTKDGRLLVTDGFPVVS